MDNINSIIDSHLNDLISDLQLLIRQPDVSAKNNGGGWMFSSSKKIMEKAGIKTELLFPQQKNAIYKDNNFYSHAAIDKDHFSLQ